MEIPKQKNELEQCLARALALVEDGGKSVANDLGFETENLEDLVSAEDQETQSHLSQLEELVNGLKKNLSSLKNEIANAQTLLAKLLANLNVEDSDEDSAGGSGDHDDVDLSAKEAGEIRHDEPVSLRSILRSLLMANEPGQRERAEKENS